MGDPGVLCVLEGQFVLFGEDDLEGAVGRGGECAGDKDLALVGKDTDSSYPAFFVLTNEPSTKSEIIPKS